MTYNTPVLSLVGAAQNLVLIGQELSQAPIQCAKSDEPLGSDEVENW